MAEVGVELRKSRHSLPVLLPYGVDFIPQEVVGRLLSHCDFAFDAFWAKLEEYQATPE